MGNCIDAMARIKLSDAANVDLFDLSARQTGLATQRKEYLNDPIRRGRKLDVFEQSVVSRMDAELVMIQGLIDKKTAADARVTQDAVRKTLESISAADVGDEEVIASGQDVLTMSARLEARRNRARAGLASIFTTSTEADAMEEDRPMLQDRKSSVIVEDVADEEEDEKELLDDGLSLRPTRRVPVSL